ncbi:Hypothetical predicted protein [Olea europaea subsp. europaea]|uniref:NPH3 domain-containing protein n=1 Tax=Olea europaea subsp. europaea TaxID=158383 RepID=A0A8S0TPE6_OLEEU|nr:Hypothetical predicted protein [Olea europaea subsp. europaea]
MDADNLSDHCWFEDLSFLRIDHFIEVIESIKRRKIQPNLVGSCIAHWTVKWFSGITLRHNNLNQKNLTVQMHKFSTECLIKILPAERNSVSCNFIPHFLKAAHIMKIDSDLLHKLERRKAIMLESCKVTYLLDKSGVTLFLTWSLLLKRSTLMFPLLQAHPNLTEEKGNVLWVLEYHKLSQDARQ